MSDSAYLEYREWKKDNSFSNVTGLNSVTDEALNETINAEDKSTNVSWWGKLLGSDKKEVLTEEEKQAKKKANKTKAKKIVKTAGNVASFGLGLFSSSSNQGTDYSSTEETKKPLSTGAKVGIGLGIVAIVGTTLFLVLRKK